MERLVAGENPGIIPLVLLSREGRRIGLEGHVNVRFEGGQALELRGIFRDMTENKRARDALRVSEENLAVILQSIGDAVMATDKEGRVARNLAAEKLTGYSEIEAMGRSFAEVFEIIHEDTRAPAVVPIQQVLDTGEAGRIPDGVLLVARDGTERPIADSAAPIRDRAGQTVGVVLVAREVTEERRAQREILLLNETLEERVQRRTAELEKATAVLRESEERFRMMVEGVQDYAIIMLDPQGNVVSWNIGAERMMGYTASEIIGQNMFRFYLEKALEAGLPQKELALATEYSHFEDEGMRVRRDGSTFWVSVVITALHDREGRLRGFSKINRDITERRENERLALRSQRLEAIGTWPAA